jgi:putative ATP-binding cassette transporter
MKTTHQSLWQRYRGIAAPYWRSEEKWQARGFLALLAALLLVQTGFAVLINQETGEFTSALAAGDRERFWAAVRWCVLWVCGAVPTYALYYLVRDRLGNHWRRWLTYRFLGRYFGHQKFYELNAHVAIDNPDQRIAEDINTFTQKSLFFGLILMGSLIQLTAFSRVLWSISHELVYFLVLYATLGTLVTLWVFGKPLTLLNFRQLRREADLRFGLIRVRENAESIALYRGEAQEQQQIRHRFASVFDNFNQLIQRQFFLNLFQYAYSMLTLVLPSAIIASHVLSGEMEVGRAVQAAGAFTAVLAAISLVVDNFESLTRFAAGVDRLAAFYQTLSAPAHLPRPDSPVETVEGADELRLENLTVQTPAPARTLLRHLSLVVEPGEGLMIVGPSGSGKSALLRTITGLWPSGGGRILRPAAQHMLFLPQQPYMLLGGSLRSQLLYPDPERHVDDERLLQALEQVNLPDLAERCGGLGAELDWDKTLSVGEQQRLAFARLLLTAPRFAFLDEATSALDLGNEARLYRALMATKTTPISVGHRAGILKYHAWVLEIQGEGRWQLMAAQDYRFHEQEPS